MNLQFYEEKLNSSEIFEEFKRENPKSYLCSAFVIIDNEGKGNKIHFDYLTEDKKVLSFQIEEEIKKVPLESPGDQVIEELNLDYDINFSDIENVILERMKEEKIGSKVQKIIFSIQKVNGKDLIMGTVFISMMGMIKIRMEMPSKKIEEFEKKSFMDIINVMKKGK